MYQHLFIVRSKSLNHINTNIQTRKVVDMRYGETFYRCKFICTYIHTILNEKLITVRIEFSTLIS